MIRQTTHPRRQERRRRATLRAILASADQRHPWLREHDRGFHGPNCRLYGCAKIKAS